MNNTIDVDYSDIKIRYWFHKDEQAGVPTMSCSGATVGCANLTLTRVEIRYYFTKEDTVPPFGQVVDEWQYYINDDTVTNYVGMGYISPSITNCSGTQTDTCYRVYFTGSAGSIDPGGSVRIENGVHKNSWSAYDKNNDYSTDKSYTSYADYTKVTVHLDASLEWGTEP